MYAVRITETHEAVGLIYANNRSELFSAVDELTDPHGCEYQPLPPGGILLGSNSPLLPLPDDGEGDEAFVSDLMVSPDLTEDWAAKLHQDKGWKAIDFKGAGYYG